MSKKIFQFILLGVMLIGFPALSWYYLKSGFEYQKKAFSELMDYGSLPSFDFPAVTGAGISTADMQDKIAVFGFLQNDLASTDSLLALYGKLHDQFKDRDEIQFVLFNLNTDYYDQERLEDRMTRFGLRDSIQIHFLLNDQSAAQQLAAAEFKVPDFSEDLEMGTPIPLNEKSAGLMDNYPYLVLSRNGEIKNYYDYRKNRSVKRLVEHLALLMPREGKKNDKLESKEQ